MQPPTIEMETKEQQPLVPSKPTSKKPGSRMLGTFTQVANSKRKLKRMTTIKRQQTQILSKVNLLSETIEHERQQLADDVFTSAAVYASETGVAKLVQLCESHLQFAHQLQQQASQISERNVQTTVPIQPSMSDIHRQTTPSLPKTIHRNEILAECMTKFPQIANKLRIAKQLYDRIAIQQNEMADKIDREKACPYPDSQQTFCNRYTLQPGKSTFPVVPCAKQVASVETMESQQFRIGNNGEQQVQCRTDEEQQVQCRTDEEQQVQCQTDEEQQVQYPTDEKQQAHCPEPIKLTAKHVSQTGIGTQLGTWLETILNSKAVDIQLDSTSIAKVFSIVQAAMHYVQHENSRECLSLGNLSLQFQHWFQNLLHRVICASQIEQNYYNRLIEERRFSIAPLQKSVSRTRHMWKKLKWSTEPRLIQIQKKLRIESLQLHNAHKVMQLEHRWLQLVSRDLKLFALKTAAVEAKRLQNFHNENRMMEQRVRIDKIRKAASIDNDIDLQQVHTHLEEVKRILQSIEATNMLTTSHAEVQPNESEFEWLGYQQACQKWKNSKAGEWKLVKQKATNPFIPISYNNLLRCIAWKYKPKSLSLRMLTKTVTEILLERLKLEKEEQSNSSLSASNQVVSLRNFVYDFFLAKFSSRKVAECRVLDFITAISKVTSSTSWWLSTFRVCAQIPSRSSITELRNQRLKERMAATEVERSMKQNTITLSGKSTEQVESTTGSQLKTKLIESSKRIRRMPTRRHSSSSASSKSTSRKKSTTTQTTSSNKGTTASYESHRKHSTLSTKQLENQEQSALDRFKYLTTKKMGVDSDSEIDFNLILLVVATLFGNSNGTPFIESRQTGVLWVPEQVAHEATAELFSHMDQKQVGKLQAEVLYNRSKWIKVRTGGGKKEAQRIEENSIPFEVYLKVLISKLSELSNRTKHGIAMWFTIVDIQNRGYLDYDQVSAVVRAISPQLSKFQVTKLYRIAVQSGNNTAQAQIPDLVVAALQLGITLPGLNSHDDQYGVASIGPRASLKPEYHDNPSVSMSAMHLEWKRNRDEIYQHINDLQQRAKTPNQVVVVEEHRTRVEQLEQLMKRNTQAYPAWCLYRLIAYSLKRTKKVAGLSSTLHCIQYITKWKSRIKSMLDRANETSFGVQRSGPSATKSFVALLRQRIEMRRANGETQDHPVFSCVRWKRVHELNKWFSEPELNLMTMRDRNRNTVLHVAVQNGHREIVALLLDKGAQVNVQNLSGQTPLHFSKMYGYRSISHYLKRSGARDDIKNNFGDCARDIPSS